MTDGMQLPFTIHFKYVDILPRGPVQGMGGGVGWGGVTISIFGYCTFLHKVLERIQALPAGAFELDEVFHCVC